MFHIRQLPKVFLSGKTKPIVFIFGIKHYLEFIYERYANCAYGVKIDPILGITRLHWIIKENIQSTFSTCSAYLIKLQGIIIG